MLSDAAKKSSAKKVLLFFLTAAVLSSLSLFAADIARMRAVERILRRRENPVPGTMLHAIVNDIEISSRQGDFYKTQIAVAQDTTYVLLKAAFGNACIYTLLLLVLHPKMRAAFFDAVAGRDVERHGGQSARPEAVLKLTVVTLATVASFLFIYDRAFQTSRLLLYAIVESHCFLAGWCFAFRFLYKKNRVLAPLCIAVAVFLLRCLEDSVSSSFMRSRLCPGESLHFLPEDITNEMKRLAIGERAYHNRHVARKAVFLQRLGDMHVIGMSGGAEIALTSEELAACVARECGRVQALEKHSIGVVRIGGHIAVAAAQGIAIHFSVLLGAVEGVSPETAAYFIRELCSRALGPISNAATRWVRRTQEALCDDYARQLGYGEELARAIYVLSMENRDLIVVPKLHTAQFLDTPSPEERINACTPSPALLMPS